MKKSVYSFLPVLLLLLAASNLNANNIQVSNTKLTGQNTTDSYTLVQFDLSWENSWRTDDLNGDGVTNWDAAWVFVKYRVGTGDWQHASLNNTGHSGTGATIDAGLLTPGDAFNATTNPGLGVFIYRSANGTGTFSITGAQLRWNYDANGVADNATVDVQVFAIEMVYVPQGAFTVGTGGTESGSFTNGSWTSGATIPLSISSENALTIGQASDNLWGTSSSGNSTIGGAGTLAASFPKGFAAFYMQKYSITQQQYVDFLNTLTYTQQNNRIDGSPDATAGTFTNDASRHKIKIKTSGVNPGTPAVYETEHPYVACNFLSWMDGAAYVDWAGLRPMTELEFEKACRGTLAPVANEFAWGTATVAGSAYTLSNASAANEGIATNYSTTAGNAMYSSTSGTIGGPLRVGIFATGSSTRTEAGASYYGLMELSGNLWERAITVGNATGRAFTGVHGDGALSANGHANQTAWPGLISGEVTVATGAGFRGGDWILLATYMRVSDRNNAAFAGSNRSNIFGFRGVRVVP